MKIGGFLKLSTIDYPGKVSSVIFTQGCNFACPYCHNYKLIHEEGKLIDNCYVISTIYKRRALIDAVTISGGEPTIQSGLSEMCQELKDMGLQVKLDTNGSNPAILQSLIDNHLVDFVSMDIKTPIDDYCFAPKDFSPQIKKSIEILLGSPVDYEFRTTCVSPFVCKENAARIGQDIKGAKKMVLQQARSHDVFSPIFFTGEGRILSLGEIMKIQEIINPYVELCEVR